MIKFNSVTKQYIRTVAIDNMNIEIDEPGIYCLLGKNGAGKTTFMKLTAGHIAANKGEIFVDDKRNSPITMPECVNFIESRATQFNLPVSELISIAKGLQDDFNSEFAESMIKKFKLDKKKKYKQLSLGMQTMVTTILSLASNSKVVMLDEPTLGFDAIMRVKFNELLLESYELHPRIIIVSTHLIDEIAKVAQKLIIIDSGKILFRADIDELDEMCYYITGMNDEISAATAGLNVIGRKTMGGFTTAYIYDKRIDPPKNATIGAASLQDFFINLVGGNEDE